MSIRLSAVTALLPLRRPAKTARLPLRGPAKTALGAKRPKRARHVGSLRGLRLLAESAKPLFGRRLPKSAAIRGRVIPKSRWLTAKALLRRLPKPLLRLTAKPLRRLTKRGLLRLWLRRRGRRISSKPLLNRRHRRRLRHRRGCRRRRVQYLLPRFPLLAVFPSNLIGWPNPVLGLIPLQIVVGIRPIRAAISLQKIFHIAPEGRSYYSNAS